MSKDQRLYRCVYYRPRCIPLCIFCSSL